MRWYTRMTAAMVAGLLAGSIAAAGVVAQDATPTAIPPDEPGVRTVALADDAGTDVGFAVLTSRDDGSVQISVTVNGSSLAPGEHGMHVHEFGLCEGDAATPFESAGGHFNPTSAPHGGPPSEMGELGMLATPGAATPVEDGHGNAHAGDLGNVTATEGGRVAATLTSDRFTVEDGPAGLADADGSALVIHLLPDDFVTQPSGDSGSRVLCGVVFPGTGAEDGAPAASPAA